MNAKTILQPTLDRLILTPRQSNKKPRCGWNSCSASGCYCRTYEGRGDTCGNCGHNYSLHY
jgi:hypothetical protein